MNARFAEYVTSGAFNLALTRSQISSLAMVAGAGDAFLMAGSALERKGLVEAIPSDSHVDRVEWRLTAAGAICLSMLFEAGLTNKGKDALAAEVDSLRDSLTKANTAALEARERMSSMYAKLEASEEKNAELLACEETARLHRECAATGIKLKERPLVSLRDRRPHMSAADLMEGVER